MKKQIKQKINQKLKANFRISKILFLLVLLFSFVSAQQGGGNIPFIDFGIRPAEGNETSLALQILLLLSILSIAPSILIMATSFIRVSIILNFIKRALSLQQEPPNQVIMALSLFITFYIMAPTFTKIYNEAYVPYRDQKLTNEKFFTAATNPLKDFMLKQVRDKDLDLFLFLAKKPRPKNEKEISLVDLVPAFMISELSKAFQIGILIFIPFLVIDIIVASILMTMGMMMIPPVMISLPFKIILFVLVDGWNLLILQTVRSFQ